MEMSRQRSSRDVLLIWLVKLQERVKRVDTFVRDRLKLSTFLSRIDREALRELVAELRLDSTLAGNLRQLLGYQTVGPGRQARQVAEDWQLLESVRWLRHLESGKLVPVVGSNAIRIFKRYCCPQTPDAR